MSELCDPERGGDRMCAIELAATPKTIQQRFRSLYTT